MWGRVHNYVVWAIVIGSMLYLLHGFLRGVGYVLANLAR